MEKRDSLSESMKKEDRRRLRRYLPSAILTVFLIILSLLAMHAGGVFPENDPQKLYWIDTVVRLLGAHREAAAVLLALLCGLYMCVRLPEGKVQTAYTVVFALLLPYVSFLAAEAYNRGWWHVGAPLSYETATPFNSMQLLNLLLYILFFLLLAFLLGSFRAGYCTAASLLMAVAIVNFYVVQFRGSPLVPWDLLSVRTAGNVAGNFSYQIHWHMLFATFLFVFVLLSAGKMRLRVKKLPARLAGIAVCAAGLVLLVGSLQKDSVKEFWGIDTTLFTPNVRYTKNGFWPAYLSNLSFLNVEKPEGYSAQRVEEIAQEAEEQYLETEEKNTDAAVDSDPRMPNIVVIMNEAFSDLSALGDFAVSEDYMPFFRSLMEDYTGGRLLVSVKGGNTANTEYEFLSGDSMAFLPAGSVVYQQYIPGELPTIASYLRGLGYRTVAMHPYLGSGWERDRVYPLMGFDEFLDQEAFSGADKLRGYVSDRGAFGKVLEELLAADRGTEAGEDRPLFCFLVTMQNHSGYTPKSSDNGFSEEIYLTDAPAQTPAVVACERYLTLIKRSDEAYEYLIHAVEERVDRPTVIVSFGDHEPGDYITQVIDSLTGNDVFQTASDNSGAKEDGGDGEDSLERIAQHYQVPFFIWNNFGVEKNTDITWMSPNYLGAYVLQESGIPLSAYQAFLVQLQRQIPASAAGAWMDADGQLHSWDDTDADERQLQGLEDYHILAYNHLMDAKNRIGEIFTEPCG